MTGSTADLTTWRLASTPRPLGFLVLALLLTATACSSDPEEPSPDVVLADTGTDLSDATVDPLDSDTLDIPATCATLDCTGQGVCDPATVSCVACLVTSECPDPLDLCVAKACVAQTACKSDKQCSSFGFLCDTATGVCVQCLADGDCSGDQACKAKTCLDPGNPCATSKDCAASQVCDKGAGACVGCLGDDDCDDLAHCEETVCVVDLCRAEETACIDATTRKVCTANGSGWTTEACASDTLCIEGTCAKSICTPGTKSCAADQNAVVTCNANGTAWSAPAACPANTTCKDAACQSHVCIPNQKKCNAQGGTDVCAADGLSATSAACPKTEDGKTQVCVAAGESAACQAQACVPGASFCDGQTAKVCDAQGLSSSVKADCGLPDAGGKAQLCLDGGCQPAACTAGSKVCADAATLATCKADGLGYDKAACGQGKVCEGGACALVVCAAGAVSCEGSVATKCNATGTKLDTSEDCAAKGKVCVNGACKAKVCTSGQIACQGGQLGTCSADGTGWTLQACPQGETCGGGKCVAKVCDAGAMGCQGKSVAACNGSGTAWVNVEDCGKSGQTCLDGTCVAASCTPGVVQCDGKKLVECNASGTGWNAGEDCGAKGQVCLEGKCLPPVCSAGAAKCDGSKVITCNPEATAWVAGVDCTASSQVCWDGKCVVCSPGAKQCSAQGKAATCKADGSGWDEVGCDDGNVCTADTCFELTGCTSSGDGAGTSCGNGMTCDASGKCVTPITPAGMVLIPAGTFWMGCNAAKDGNCESNEKPQHKVTLSAYYMDLTETTVGQYNTCVAAKACAAPSQVQPAQYATYPGLTNNPVNYVSWTQSRAYCKWRGLEYDLPTEAQWEMAARGSCEKNGSAAGDATCAAAMRTYPWGEANASCSYVVMKDDVDVGCGTKASWAVGQKTAGDSPYGLHDMLGNMWEWNRDWYDSYTSGAQTNPVGPGSASDRVLRGGGFTYPWHILRSSYRFHDPPSFVSGSVGLRCVKSFP